MPKYVDAEKIEKTLWDSLRGYRHVKEKCAVKNCILEIEEAPTADVVEVKHGYWIEYSGDPNIITCSECDWGTGVDEKFFKYCPNCGAIMDVKKEGICND